MKTMFERPKLPGPSDPIERHHVGLRLLSFAESPRSVGTVCGSITAGGTAPGWEVAGLYDKLKFTQNKEIC